MIGPRAKIRIQKVLDRVKTRVDVQIEDGEIISIVSSDFYPEMTSKQVEKIFDYLEKQGCFVYEKNRLIDDETWYRIQELCDKSNYKSLQEYIEKNDVDESHNDSDVVSLCVGVACGLEEGEKLEDVLEELHNEIIFKVTPSEDFYDKYNRLVLEDENEVIYDLHFDIDGRTLYINDIRVKPLTVGMNPYKIMHRALNCRNGSRVDVSDIPGLSSGRGSGLSQILDQLLGSTLKKVFFQDIKNRDCTFIVRSKITRKMIRIEGLDTKSINREIERRSKTARK